MPDYLDPPPVPDNIITYLLQATAHPNEHRMPSDVQGKVFTASNRLTVKTYDWAHDPNLTAVNNYAKARSMRIFRLYRYFPKTAIDLALRQWLDAMAIGTASGVAEDVAYGVAALHAHTARLPLYGEYLLHNRHELQNIHQSIALLEANLRDPYSTDYSKKARMFVAAYETARTRLFPTWLQTLLDEHEYNRVRHLNPHLLQELYPNIWENGADLTRVWHSTNTTE